MSTPLLENGRPFFLETPFPFMWQKKKNVTNEDELEGVASTRYTSVRFWNPHLTV